MVHAFCGTSSDVSHLLPTYLMVREALGRYVAVPQISRRFIPGKLFFTGIFEGG
jgi:hypothetical protein